MSRLVKVEIEYSRTVQPVSYESKGAKATFALAPTDDSGVIDPSEIDSLFALAIDKVHTAVGLKKATPVSATTDPEPALSQKIAEKAEKPALNTVEKTSTEVEEEIPTGKRGRGRPPKKTNAASVVDEEEPVEPAPAPAKAEPEEVDPFAEVEEITVGTIRNAAKKKYDELKADGRGKEVSDLLAKHSAAPSGSDLQTVISGMSQEQRQVFLTQLEKL